MFWFSYGIKVNIVLLFGALIYAIFFSRMTFHSWNRNVLLGIILVSLTLPFLNLPLTDTISQSLNWQEWNVGTPSPIGGPTEATESNTNLLTALVYAYLGGCLLMTIRFGSQLVKLAKIIKNGRQTRSEQVVLVRQNEVGYASFFNYIFIPEGPAINPVFARQALLHERVHVRQGHSWDILLIEIIKVIFWLNPAVYALNHYIKLVHEYLADQEVLNEFSKLVYAKNLVTMVSGQPDYTLIHYLTIPNLKNRLKMMNTRKTNSNQKARFLVTVPLLAFLSVIFSFNQGEIQKESIVGEWKGSAFSFEQISGPDVSAMISGGEALHIGGTFLLGEDGSYEIRDPQGNQNGTGTWSLEEDMLTTKAADLSTQAYQVLELSENRMKTEHLVMMDTPDGEVKGKIYLTYKK